MVNVPGRSKGCKTCRKRKLKCSGERPECMLCIKSGRNCLGYQRDRVFVHSNVVKEAEKDKVRRRTRKTSSEQRSDVEIEIERNEQPPVYISFEETFIPEHMENSLDYPVSSALVSASLRKQLLASYARNYINAAPRAGPDGVTWITSIPTLPNPSKALETVAYAVSLARLGSKLNAPDMIQESVRLYTRSLYYFQLALWDPVMVYSDDTFAACVLLTMYEVFQTPDGSRDGYWVHSAGCAKLVQLRGPEAHIDGLGHSIFQWYRYGATLESLQTKSTFLAQEKWRTIPFTKYPKVPMQRVLDLLLETPMILTRADDLRTMPLEEKLPVAVKLLEHCISVESWIDQVYSDLEYFVQGPTYWIMPSAQSGSSTDPSSASYSFPNAGVAITMMLSWAALTVFWSGICHLYQLIGFLTTLSTAADGKLLGRLTEHGSIREFSFPPPTRYKDFPQMARNVCQSVEYCAQDEVGIAALSCPLALIVDGLSSWPGFERDVARARGMMDCIRKQGIGIMKYIRWDNEDTSINV